MSHDNGHLLYRIMGWRGDPHFNPLHVLSNLLIVAGTEAELANMVKTIETFDVDQFAGMSVGLFRLSAVDVRTVRRELARVEVRAARRSHGDREARACQRP